MTAAAPTRSSERELQDLYGRYKTLVLAVSAALMLDEPFEDVAREADLLAADCVAAARSADCFAAQFAACVTAAEELSELLDRMVGEDWSEAQLDALRASHSRLRHEVWNVLPCEYVPCCAPAHAHLHR